MLLCQRIGCSEKFTEDDNAEGSCRYHPGPPLFHDGKKEWSCCKKRSHDFGDFMSLPGCTQGKHSKEKPVTKAAPSPNERKPAGPTLLPSSGDATFDASRAACPRCRQGFFCSDHQGLLPGGKLPSAFPSQTTRPPSSASPSTSAATAASTAASASATSAAAKSSTPRVVDFTAEQTCSNKGCGVKFREKDNSDTACSFHPGPAVFHDRRKGWACCDVHVKDFDEFMTIPPCQKGWHNAG
eukprot:TRINITY_DN3752_c0_g1_i1.p1 TRINITY_DN3752_c0_g1~~TRINITY_DN3752_c0_g1_i1.p1  ORF type:complete len:240 (+),score=30.35 TRINITY_DN3752_c0_g1_i1:252-971(+)